MRRIIIATLLIFLLQNGFACEPAVANLRVQHLGFCNAYNQHRIPSFYPGFRRGVFEFALPGLNNPVARYRTVPGYTGIPFKESAVFCRMENHFLTRYSVKFSIHAGGYREVGTFN